MQADRGNEMEWNENAGTSSFSGASMNQGMGDNATQGSSAGTGSTIDEAREKARQAAGNAQQKISEQLRSKVDSSRTRAADALGSVASALSQSGEQLRSENQEMPSDYIGRAGDQIRRASDYLRSTSTDEMVRNAEGYARRQPAVFLGGAFLLGFLAARLVKSGQETNMGGSIPRDRSLVAQDSTFRGDRERNVSGFREPGMSGSTFDTDTDPSYTREFGRETL
jgi:hypothetical protein